MSRSLKKEKLSPCSQAAGTSEGSSKSWCRSVARCSPAAPAEMCFSPGWALIFCIKRKLQLVAAVPAPS